MCIITPFFSFRNTIDIDDGVNVPVIRSSAAKGAFVFAPNFELENHVRIRKQAYSYTPSEETVHPHQQPKTGARYRRLGGELRAIFNSRKSMLDEKKGEERGGGSPSILMLVEEIGALDGEIVDIGDEKAE